MTDKDINEEILKNIGGKSQNNLNEFSEMSLLRNLKLKLLMTPHTRILIQ